MPIHQTLVYRGDPLKNSSYVADGHSWWIDDITDALPVVITHLDYFDRLEIKWLHDKTSIIVNFKNELEFSFYEYEPIKLDDLDDIISLWVRREYFDG